jgi:two-component system OmpR family response regulator
MTLRTFLVEDDEHIRTVLSELMRTAADISIIGHATTEISAMTWLVSEPNEWDLAVIDLMLAQGSGLRVLSGCRVRQHRQKMVVLTNHATKEMRRRCADLGADAVFDKATETEQLLEYCTDLRRRA